MRKSKLSKNVLILDTHIEPIESLAEGWFAAIDLTVSIQVNEQGRRASTYGYHYTFRLIGQVYQDNFDNFRMQPLSLVLFEVTIQDNDHYRSVVISPRFFNPNYIYYLTEQNIIEEFLETLQESPPKIDSPGNLLTEKETYSEDNDRAKINFFEKWFSDMLLGYYNEELLGDEQIIIDAAFAVLIDYINTQEKQA